MTEAQRQKFHRICDEMDRQTAQANLSTYDNMCGWLRREQYDFYIQVKDNLLELWEEAKQIASDILEGFGKLSAAAVVTPVVGIYEGVKEGLENGLEAGVKKGFKAMGDFLDELFK